MLKRKFIARFLITILVTCLCKGAIATDLQEVLSLTLSTNNQLKVSRINLEGQLEVTKQIVSQKEPIVSANISNSNSWDLNENNDQDTFSADLAAAYTLYDGNKLNHTIKAERYRIGILKENLRELEQKVLLDAILAYLNVLRDLRLVELSEKNVSVLQQQLDATSSRFSLGELTRTDVAYATAALESAKSVLSARKGALYLSQSAFQAVVGIPPDGLTEQIYIPTLPKTLDEAKEIAFTNNPKINAGVIEEKRFRALLEVAKAKSQPTISLSSNISTGHTSSNGGRSALGLRLSGSLPIYSGGALKSGEREASAALEAAITKSLLDRISISQSVISSWSNLQVSAAVISARKREVEASELAYLGTIEEARLGSRTILDVLNAEQALMNTRTELATAESDSLAAGFQLLMAIGKLDQKTLGIAQ
ncbi:MAG: TolC family protein [Pseudomonadota bacterium]|nr:TolC family protein [Pseudomonadota bacterium]